MSPVMPYHSLRRCALLTTLALMPAMATADGVQWNGFLNVVGGIGKEPYYTPLSNDSVLVHDEGYGENFTLNHDTSAGLQASANLNDRTLVTAQLYASGADENYEAQMKWLYLTWKMSQTSKFRVGKLGLPIYYYSDYMNVGYAYHWVTPPDWVYAYDTTFTGIDYLYQDTVADMAWSVEVLGGSQDQVLRSIDATLKAKNLTGLVFQLEPTDQLTLRTAWFQETASYEFEELTPDRLANYAIDEAVRRSEATPDIANALRATRSTLISSMRPFLDEILTNEDLHGYYNEYAIRYEQDDWFVMAEWTGFTIDEYLLQDSDGWFLTGGIRNENVLYHLTYAQLEVALARDAANDVLFVQRDPLSVPPGEIPEFLARSVRQELVSAFAGKLHDWTLGMNIDTGAHSVLKFQITYSEQDEAFDGDDKGVGHNVLLKTALNVMF